MNQRHPSKTTKTYREYVHKKEALDEVARRQRRSRSEIIRDATAEFLAYKNQNLWGDFNEHLLETLSTLEAPEGARESAASEVIQLAAAPKEPKSCNINYSEFRDVLEDLEALGRRDMLTASDMIRRATLLYITKHQQPTPIEKYVEKRKLRTTSELHD